LAILPPLSNDLGVPNIANPKNRPREARFGPWQFRAPLRLHSGHSPPTALSSALASSPVIGRRRQPQTGGPRRILGVLLKNPCVRPPQVEAWIALVDVNVRSCLRIAVSSRSAIVKSFGRRLAYESLRRTNPRASQEMGNAEAFLACRRGLRVPVRWRPSSQKAWQC